MSWRFLPLAPGKGIVLSDINQLHSGKVRLYDPAKVVYHRVNIGVYLRFNGNLDTGKYEYLHGAIGVSETR